MVRPRDSQKSRLYKAERAALDKISKRLDTIDDITRFVDRIRKRATIVRRYGYELKRSVFIGDGRGKRNAGGDSRGIYMPKWSRTEYIVLHELSHCIACRRYGRYNIAAHGREFAAVYVDLVRYIIGKEAADALKASFREHRVKFRRSAA
jgi:putative metallohydrolase (TIGR04338 family)